MPRIRNLPPQVRIGHLVTPSPYTEYGVKGAGEGGRMVAPPAVACAIEDALRPLGVRIDTLPVTPSRLRALIREAEARKGKGNGKFAGKRRTLQRAGECSPPCGARACAMIS